MGFISGFLLGIIITIIVTVIHINYGKNIREYISKKIIRCNNKNDIKVQKD